MRTCRTPRPSLLATSVQTRSASVFTRAQQTAVLLRDGPSPSLLIERLLKELEYGDFEGAARFLDYAGWFQHHGTWTRQPAADKS